MEDTAEYDQQLISETQRILRQSGHHTTPQELIPAEQQDVLGNVPEFLGNVVKEAVKPAIGRGNIYVVVKNDPRKMARDRELKMAA